MRSSQQCTDDLCHTLPPLISNGREEDLMSNVGAIFSSHLSRDLGQLSGELEHSCITQSAIIVQGQ